MEGACAALCQGGGGDELEIRCWKGESSVIQAACRYGKAVEEHNEVSIRGKVTEDLLLELMDEAPAEKSGYHAMTKYFTINVKNELCDFCSAHYGTEMYLQNLSEEDVAFVEGIFSQYGDVFSIWMD